jgi:hypothetical protein
MPNFRMLPPAIVAGGPATSQTSMVVNGRTYSAAPGSVLDVPDMDGAVLAANGWVKVAASGTTAQRPTSTSAPFRAAPEARYFDTSLGKLIVYDGVTWRDPATGSAV